MQGENQFYVNEGGKRFVDRTADSFPKTPWGAMGIKWFDYDNDGKMDLFITDMHSDMSAAQSIEEEKKKSKMAWNAATLGGNGGESSIFGNAFFHNLGGGKFEEISDALGVEDYWPWGPSIGDLNADGYEDIFIAASMNYPFHYAIDSVLLNDRGKKFRDAEFLVGVEPRRDGKTEGPAFDLDCSGGDKDLKLCEGRTGKFTVMGALGTRSAVIFDIDGDGDLDIVTNELNSVPQVLVSDLAAKKKIHWAKIDLVGTKSNRNGLGATVRLTAGGQTYTRYNDGKSGYLSQSILPLYFGLGDATSISKIEVVWPSGKRQALTANLKADSRIRITEPK